MPGAVMMLQFRNSAKGPQQQCLSALFLLHWAQAKLLSKPNVRQPCEWKDKNVVKHY